MNEETRRQNILQILSKTYPNAHIALSYDSPWELLVAVILSAQCTDIMVNKVTKTLFQKYPTLESYTKTTIDELEKFIKPTGFYHNKAKHIIESAKIVQTKFHGVVPNTMDTIMTLPGVARKTANVVLGNAYGIVEGIAVDTHVFRLSQRLRLIPLSKIGDKHPVYFQKNSKHSIDYNKGASPEKIETELMLRIPKSRWFSLTYELIEHGRAVCKAQNPKCNDCLLKTLCPSSRAT